MSQSSDQPAGKSRPPCPICRAPSDKSFHPFCSRRCADVDLSRWLRGAYAIPVSEYDDEDGEGLPAASPDQNRGGNDLH